MKMKRELEIILLQHQVKVFHCFCSPLLATLLVLNLRGEKKNKKMTRQRKGGRCGKGVVCCHRENT